MQLCNMLLISGSIRFSVCAWLLHVAGWIHSSVTYEFWGVGSFSLPAGEALGCASGRFGLGTAAHINCERERQGVMRGCGTVVSSGGGDRKEEQERESGG